MPATRLEFEQELLRQGVLRIAGVDEAGRGPLAGPVVAAAAQLPREWIEAGLPPDLVSLHDSKQLTARQRDFFYERLTTSDEVCFGIGIVDAAGIDALNILQATHQAMRTAVASLSAAPEHLLVDGLRVAVFEAPQTAIVGGDARSYSIAAASVIAKVTRDRMMEAYDARYPSYGFAAHKGYGTTQHLAALRRLGPCPIHRRSFAPVRQMELGLGAV